MGSIAGNAVVADDDPFFRIALASILTGSLGFSEVHQAGCLDGALEALSERTDVRVALFDLSMPGMQSAASLAAVRECHPDVLVIVVSGSTDRDDVLLALRAGVHGFVEKGTSVEALVKALRMVFEGLVYVPPFVTKVSGADGLSRPDPAAWREAARDPTAGLTPRQRQVLDLIGTGLSNKEIARALSLGEGTVKIHVAALLRTLGVPNRAAAAAWGGAKMAWTPAQP
ncbi:response regulator [Methylobacterium sp. C33D]